MTRRIVGVAIVFVLERRDSFRRILPLTGVIDALVVYGSGVRNPPHVTGGHVLMALVISSPLSRGDSGIAGGR